MISICVIGIAAWMVLMRADSTTPSAVSIAAPRNSDSSSITTTSTLYLTPTNRPSTSTMQACSVAVVAPPSTLPTMIAALLIGRDEHLAQEAELAVPDQRDAGEHRREQHRHREHAREQERAEVDVVAGAR